MLDAEICLQMRDSLQLYEILAPKPELTDFNGPSQKVKQIIACK